MSGTSFSRICRNWERNTCQLQGKDNCGEAPLRPPAGCPSSPVRRAGPSTCHLPARPAAAAPGAEASEHVQQPMERGAFQRAVHLHDQGKRLPAMFTHWPRRCYRGQGVLRAGAGATLRPGQRPGPSPPLTPHQHPPTRLRRPLTGRPPSLLAVQAPGPVGQPCTAASGRPSSTGFRTAAMTTGDPREQTNYGSPDGAPRCARAPPTSASRPRPLEGLSEVGVQLLLCWPQNPGAPGTCVPPNALQ